MYASEGDVLRLDKYISVSAALTRSESQRTIRAGRVAVNNTLIRDPAMHIRGDECVTLDGNVLSYSEFIYIMLNKPAGYISATEDARPGERVVTELLPPELLRRKPFPVGRLDRDTTGLIIMTNDGASAHRALSPNSHVAKTYRFTCSPPLSNESKVMLERGVDIGEVDSLGRSLLTAPAIVTINSLGSEGEITITEGKFHQIKRMFTAVGSKITSLSRVSFAGIALDESLPAGGWRYLTPEEIEKFTSAGRGKAGM